MKKLFILCMVTLIFACKEEPKMDYTLFSGQIENPTAQVVSIYNGREKVKDLPLNESNSFSDTLRVELGYYTLSHGRESSSIFLAPSYDIKLTLNTKEFDETISYSGKGSENNNYLAAKYIANENANLDYTKVFALEEDEFLSKMNALKNDKLKMLNNTAGLSEAFKTQEKKNIEYEYFSDLQNYWSYHSYYAKKEEFTPSEDFIQKFNSIDFNNQEDYASLDSYKRLVQNYYNNKISKSDNPSEVFKDINSNGFTQLKEDLANSLRYNIGPNNEHNETLYKGLMAMSSNEKFKEDITKKYNIVKTLSKGMPSPEFVEYENHKGGTTSLKDLKGKYVYVDVWATWCGPCIREIPSLKKVEEEFHDKNIAFVSTSIDKAKDHNTWVEMVKNKDLGGIQLMADNDWNSQFVKDYAIEGIPRFILIDPEGNIVSADAPRPSDPKLIKMFKELKI
jgi:thiol-disulfide isomerase/thioredoxin